jgi:hypothetical protein
LNGFDLWSRPRLFLRKRKKKEGRGETPVKLWRRRRRDNRVFHARRQLALSIASSRSSIFLMNFFFLFILLASSVVIGQAESTRCLSSCTTELTPYGTPSWNHYTCMSTQYPTYLSYLYFLPGPGSPISLSLYSLHRPLSLPPLLTHTLPLVAIYPHSPILSVYENRGDLLLTCMGQWLFQALALHGGGKIWSPTYRVK